ncbi:MAG: SIMPL domain-containing protein [Candidatus Aenigmatarchaeota archaeon]
MSKTGELLFLVLVLGIVALGILVVLKPTAINFTGKVVEEGSEKINTIQVTGNSRIFAEPDKAEIILGVETQEKSALESQQKNAGIMEKVLNALKANGISKSDIKTYEYGVYPIRNYNIEKENYYEVIGYTTRHMVIVKTNDLKNLGKVIDAAASAGANNFYSISFGLSEEKEKEYRNAALTEASKNAKEKAESIAEGLGLKIQKVSSVSESFSYQPIPIYRYAYGKEAISTYDSTTEISSGMIEISAQVSVEYLFS